jgi:hypothetical protein
MRWWVVIEVLRRTSEDKDVAWNDVLTVNFYFLGEMIGPPTKNMDFGCNTIDELGSLGD